MKFLRKHSTYIIKSGGTKCMVTLEKDCWETYYRKEGYPYKFAFGLPKSEEKDTVLSVALANIEEYADFFEEE